MKVSQALLLISVILLLSTGQILFKIASAKIDQNYNNLISSFIFNLPLIIGLFIYGIATIIWILVLRSMPLNFAYPFAALGFIFVPFFSFLFLGEKITIYTLAGALIIIFGVYVSNIQHH